jgi:hypothetical protein
MTGIATPLELGRFTLPNLGPRSHVGVSPGRRRQHFRRPDAGRLSRDRCPPGPIAPLGTVWSTLSAWVEPSSMIRSGRARR